MIVTVESEFAIASCSQSIDVSPTKASQIIRFL